MKKLFIFAVAALAMIGCTKKDNLSLQNAKDTNGIIAFGSLQEKMTKADKTGADAATKLNNDFIVYGFKYSGAEDETTTPVSGNDKKVFDLYHVGFIPGTAGTTESNSSNWEYVGYNSAATPSVTQSIKYWDYSTTGYVFSAVSGVGIIPTKTTTGATVYDKGWTVELPAGGDLSDLYASERVEVLKTSYNNVVTLKFYNLGAKIRFAMYETVPGYSVKIDKFYYKDASDVWHNTTTNFAIGGDFRTANASTTTPLTITYYNGTDGVVNRPKVTFADANVTKGVYGEFGTYIQAQPAIGTTSALATYDQNKDYTYILPYNNTDGMLMYVDYTLTSTDGSGEEIKVKHASAKVPANFTNWKENFAYTYIFKISDNTNGNTGNPGGDPDDPNDDPSDDPDDPSNPKGLFPITFDACVIDAEDGIQETITSVTEPSITTYQEGVVVTANNEYVAGKDIYFENGTANVAGYKVYEVNNFGSIENISEEVVANYINNFCVLTEVAVTYATDPVADFIPLSDGTFIKKGENQAAKFTPVAGKTYVITDGTMTTPAHIKVVKVEGTATNRTYTLTQATNGSDVIAAWTDAAAHSVHYQMLSDNTATDKGAFGAKSLIKVYNSSDKDVTANFDIDVTAIASIYSIKPNAAALAAGKIADDTYTVKAVSDKDGSVIATGSATFSVSYAVAANTVTIVAGKNADITPTVGGATITKATIANVPDGITIKETATAGTYNVVVAPTVANGDYNITFAGKTVTVTVDSYAFYNVPEFTFNYLGTDAAKTLNLRKNFGDADVEVSAMTGIDAGVATITKATPGAYTVVPVAPGTYTVTYENTSATIVVNQYTLTPYAASIKKAVQSTALTLKKNNGEETIVNASTSKVTVYKGSVDPLNVVTTGFSLTTNGQVLNFGNVVEADTYIFHYTENAKVVAEATVVVTL